MYTKLSEHILGVWLIVNACLSGLWDIIDNRSIVRRSAYVLMWYITFQAYHFCFSSVVAAKYDPAAIAALFAILTPVSLLQAAVFKFYLDSRSKKEE